MTMTRDGLMAALRTELPGCRVNIRVLFEPLRYAVWVVGRGGEEAAQAVLGSVALTAGIPQAAQTLAQAIADSAPGMVAL